MAHAGNRTDRPFPDERARIARSTDDVQARLSDTVSILAHDGLRMAALLPNIGPQRSGKEQGMISKARMPRIGLLVGTIVVLAVATGLALQIVPGLKKPVTKHSGNDDGDREAQAVLSDRCPDTLEVPHEVVDTLQVRTGEVKTAPAPMPLKLEGSLFLDPNRLAHVHARFPGEIMELGRVTTGTEKGHPPEERTLRFGDPVKQGQLLAVVWSKDLGEKKSEMVDAISRLTLDQETLARLQELFRDGALPERSLREQERIVESDSIAIARAERTLRAWRLSDEDLEDIRSEAARIHERRGTWDQDLTNSWARVEIRSVIDGTIVEKNVAVGDVVDTQLDLFKIANLERLDVLAHAYEEDLPVLESLKPEEQRWKILLKGDPMTKPLAGSFDQLSSIIDPNQHTALVMGWVDNKEKRLRVGQFVTAIIELPPQPNEVEVPASALVDDEGETYVFVQENVSESKFTLRRVIPVRRRDANVYLVSKPDKAQLADGYKAITTGERVVTSGCLEMAQALRDLQASAQVTNK
jgi:cobalt-zinc-cadmium efflux system membrane fusion protein